MSSPDDHLETLHTLELAFNLAPVGMCVSRQRIVELCNETFARQFGYEV
ncbi:MAG: PAS domain-containing protein, partial [Polaromonas sp.]|nr:PAS domain-containing protein [Polaromonas sp.]